VEHNIETYQAQNVIYLASNNEIEQSLAEYGLLWVDE
jgi:hypothetical protein